MIPRPLSAGRPPRASSSSPTFARPSSTDTGGSSTRSTPTSPRPGRAPRGSSSASSTSGPPRPRHRPSDILAVVLGPPFLSLDHVQLAIPAGGEDVARRFYGQLLGLVEVPKPPEQAKRGGCWFESGSVSLHLGVEEDFRPARKAHPALRCRDYAGMPARLEAAGVAVRPALDVPGVTRCHIEDPFGNRIELCA